MARLIALFDYLNFSQPLLARKLLAVVALLGFVLAGTPRAAGDENHAMVPALGAIDVPTREQAEQTGLNNAAWLEFALTDMLGEQAGTYLLAQTDADHYRQIFELQSNGDLVAADALIALLSDKSLLGYAQFQRYISPTYKSSYKELQAWLDAYADHPEAGQIHKLAMRLKPKKGAGGLDSPSAGRGINGGLTAAGVVASTDPTSFQQGLAAWRVRDYAGAAAAFQQLANNEKASPWDQAAGAFWTARALVRQGKAKDVSPWLQKAAKHPRTFYGLIASRQLGVTATLNWDIPTLSAVHLVALGEHKAGKRALQLLQLGKLDFAEAELRAIHPRGNEQLEEALVAMAAAVGLPNLALRVGTAIPAPGGALYDAALYPVPRWEPEDGFRVDRALIFALVRQESKFDTDARSHAGATGLMQLMPRTANYIAGVKLASGQLKDPQFNLTLGQKYVEYLMKQREIEGNLFYLLTAYNSGPGMLGRWKKSMAASNDPLLFIESIPAGETRDFIERVLANYWIYQLQLAQPTPSLDAVAAGEWPSYAPLDENVLRVADRIAQ
jgi:soluble lytic murein transglycosylase